jgi:hypothetical protein
VGAVAELPIVFVHPFAEHAACVTSLMQVQAKVVGCHKGSVVHVVLSTIACTSHPADWCWQVVRLDVVQVPSGL